MKRLALGVVTTLFAASAAWALPAGPRTGTTDTVVVDVKKQSPRHPGGGPRPGPPPGKKPPPFKPGGPGFYKPGHHYKHPPPGWRRYHKRPPAWWTMGCVKVGPLWFCP